MAQNSIPLGDWSGSNATNALHETVKKNDKKANKKTNIIIILSATSVIIALVSLILQIIKH